MAGASGRASLRAGERRHSPFIRQRRQKAMPARIRGKSQLSIAREGFLDRRSKRGFWLLLSPQTKVARAGARNSPCAGCGRDEGVLRRCAATPHPPPSGAPSPQGEGLRVRHSHRGPLKGKANGGTPFNTATHQGGRLTEVCHSTPRTSRGKAWEIKRSARGRFFWLCLSLFGGAGQARQGQERQGGVEGYAGVGGLGRTLGIVGLSIGGRVVVIAAGGGRCPHGIQRQRHF